MQNIIVDWAQKETNPVGRVIADMGRLQNDSWNKALGNKILHILFGLKLHELHGYQPIIPCDSNIDNIFEYRNGCKANMPSYSMEGIPIIYQEQTAFDEATVEGVVAASKRQFESHLSFLRSVNHKGDFVVRGHYWHHGLMPSAETFNKFLGIRSDIESQLRNKYPTMLASNAVAVHLRDTDFATAFASIFPKGVMLDDDYYLRAIERVESLLGSDVEFHLFSDNLSRLVRIFSGRKYVVHDDSAYSDWAALLLMNKIISTNSSFAWTASLYNKDLILLPQDGFNYFGVEGSVPFGFEIPGAQMIHRS